MHNAFTFLKSPSEDDELQLERQFLIAYYSLLCLWAVKSGNEKCQKLRR